MNSAILKILLVFITFVSTIFPSIAEGKIRKVYSAQERAAEEARIRKDIEAKLDWQNRTKETLDDYDDEHRLLYSKLNESILLRSSTGERFGIYESFDQGGYKRFEIRLHKKNKITDRFLSGRVICDAIALSAEKVTTEYVLFREVCYRNDNPTHTLYLFDYQSRNLYWLYSDEVTYSKKPIVTLKNGTYRVRWDVKAIGAETNHSIVRNFSLIRTKGNKWEAKRLPPVNDEADDIAAEEKMPVDEKYDLPAFVAAWGK
ncbi:MAG TPA: hypothetical protein VEC35_18390 [Noviherbaspirillum sp.]|nr:hypothetical protein [Noviherbaspirillum sp.]